uniref:Putative papain-like cysteine prorease n=1 Tax=Plasmodium simiovale TaxID=35085 RepID=F1SYW7_PLASM|nr:putative papain-like cysteine prorease [Plasmodium simiovale]
MNPRVCFTWAICALLGTDVGAKLAEEGLWTGSASPPNERSNYTDAKKSPLDRGSDRGVSPEYSSDIEADGAVPHPTPDVPPRNEDDIAGRGQPPQQVVHPLNRITSVATPPMSKRSEVEVRSALLKDHDGVKITGTCNAKFQLFLVPHISINVEAESNTIQLGRKLEDVTITKEFYKGDRNSSQRLQFEENMDFLLNQCAEGKTFKFVVIVKGEELILKWKVYEKVPSATDNNKIDVRKYVLKNLGSPISAIQVHSGKEDNDVFLLESKAYLLRQDIPSTCERIATNCFLSGKVDIEGCYKCTLLSENTKLGSPCFSYLPPDVKHNYEKIKMKAQDEGDPEKYQLEEFIRRILQLVQKMGKNNTPRKGETKVHFPNDNFRELLLSYCQMMKKMDSSGTLEEHELGNEMDVLTNLKGLLRNHSNEEIPVLREKLKNPAICMKDASKWVLQKRGLALPLFEYKHLQRRRVTTPVDSQEDNKPRDKKNVFKDMHIPGYRAVIDLSQKSGMNYSNLSGDMFCNEDYCDRWKDKNSCFSNIETEEQGNCNLSWLFTSKTHLETIRCMKGYDHLGSSALYVANCSKRGSKSRCTSGSNPYEFLTIVEENGFLPPALSVPYSYGNVGNGCPKQEDHWQNLWANVKLLEPSDEPNSVSTKGYTSYESDDFRGNIEAFVNLVKREVRSKGSVMAYVKALGVLGYDMNGKEVHSLCGDKRPDHAVNIIGYGNYINAEGLKKSYWLVRNSWGKYWGDEGNFKVDMHGPAHCQHNFVHTAAVFNVHVPLAESPSKREAHLYNYYLKSSPDFLGNIYYKNISRKSGTAEKGRTGRNQSLAVQGQEGQSELLESSNPSATANRVEEPKGARENAPKRGNAGKRISEDPQIEVVNEELISESPLAPIPQEALREGQVEANPAPPLTVAASLPLRGNELLVRDGTDEGITKAATVEVLHILKHIKNGKVKLGIVTYDDDSDIAGDHSCSRSLAQDSEQLAECIQFCHDEWPNCRDEASPGYCLAQRRKAGDCFFCYV